MRKGIRAQGIHHVAAIVLNLSIALTLATASSAAASTAGVLRLATPAAAHLAAHPGGKLLNAWEISYSEGAFIITIAGPNATNVVGSCPDGYFCFWDKPYFAGRMGKLRDCYGQDLGQYGWSYRIASAFYNLDWGSVQFRYGAIGLFEIGVTNRSKANAGSNSYLATNVYRYC